MNHGSDDAPIYQPYDREAGLLVCLDRHGDEVRAHQNDHGRWEFKRWRVNMGRWIGCIAFGLTGDELWQAAKLIPRYTAFTPPTDSPTL
jgi:hypothetical protein